MAKKTRKDDVLVEMSAEEIPTDNLSSAPTEAVVPATPATLPVLVQIEDKTVDLSTLDKSELVQIAYDLYIALDAERQKTTEYKTDNIKKQAKIKDTEYNTTSVRQKHTSIFNSSEYWN